MENLQTKRPDYKVVPVTILLVEDNPDHVILIEKALGVDKVINQVDVCVDGQEAIDYLDNVGKYQDTEKYSRPGLILLDISLPKKSGLEVLSHIKNDSSLKLIPVVMLSTSKKDKDVVQSYKNGANSYVEKPIDFVAFVRVVKNLKLYWCLVNKPIFISEEKATSKQRA